MIGLLTELENRGIIPVLVTLPGPVGDPTVIAYNNAIYQLAVERDLPLFNLYAIGANNPILISGNQLLDPGVGLRADFTQPALNQYGLNVAIRDMLRTLDQLLEVINP
jgi:hypothetical protein